MVDLVMVRITFGIVILPPPSKVSVYKIYKVVDFACVLTYSMAEYFRDISPRPSFPRMQSRSFYLSQTYLFIRLVEFL